MRKMQPSNNGTASRGKVMIITIALICSAYIVLRIIAVDQEASDGPDILVTLIL